MRNYFLLASFIYSVSVVAQGSNPELPKLIPPSPEVASLMNAGLTSSSLHTGAAAVSIPVYEISAGAIKVPVSINYSSNGIKADEIPTRTGLGWNLNAGGMISRTIHDEPDGLYTTLTPPSDLSVQNQQLLDFLNAASGAYGANNFDTEPDEYSYNFPGGSGKFFVAANGAIRCIPHNNLKITMNGTASSRYFSITTTDGTIYNFGYNNAVEKTSSFTINGGVTKTEAYETGWFLNQVVSLNGDVVNFNYSSISMVTLQGPFQTLIKPILPLQYNNTTCSNGSYTSAYSEQTGVNSVNYNSKYLNYIETNNGIRVDFSYTARPDASGDNRLAGIYIKSGSAAAGYTTVRQFTLEFDDNAVNTVPPNGNNSLLNKRYFLKKVKSVSLNGSDPALDYKFDYVDQMGMGPRLTYDQDYFGYYNGVKNNAWFAPKYNQPLTVNASHGGDRTPDGAFGQKGLLQRVTYPTGGYEEFEYEPQTIGGYDQVLTTATATAVGSGTGSNNPVTYTMGTYLVKRNHNATLNISAFDNPAFPGSPPPNGTDRIAEVKILNGSQTVFSRNIYTYTPEVHTIALTANNYYTVQVTAWGQTRAGRADLLYDIAETDTYVWTNKDVGGLRVKKIAAFDPVSNKVNNRYYKYATRNDLSKSTGTGASQTDYVKPYKSAWICSNGAPGGLVVLVTNNYMISSSSLLPYYSFGGSHVAYTNVIECDDPDMKNGGTEHYFQTTPGSTIYESFLGESIQGLPQNIRTDMNGTEWKTVVFKKQNSQLITLKEVRNVIDYDSRIDNQHSGIIARMHWQHPYHFTPPSAQEFEGFDLLKYYYVSYWPRPDSTITTEYDQNGANPMVTRTGYSYNNINHLTATKTETFSSTGELLKSETKFPEDFATAFSVYDWMVQRNVTTVPVEQTSYRGTKLISTVKTDYKDWFNNQQVFAPEIISAKKGTGTSEPRIHYYGYDATGNTLEVSKESGMRLSYLWDYNNTYPIAEVKNAPYNDIAFTSFEADGKGRWIFSGASGAEASEISGKKSYSLSSGNIYRDNLNSGTTYIVTYWSKNGSVSSVGGTVRNLITLSPWTCYEHTVTGVSTITLSGSATIDELRLYPQGSFMTTYCYDPLVGIYSNCSPANLFNYYEYDGFKRLLLVRDYKKNIIKQFDYKYGQTIASCPNTNPDWQWTTEKRCLKDANNNNTGVQEKEERDMNNCSATYLQTRWVSLGVTGQCPPTPCTGADKRVVNGVCQTGTKIVTVSVNLGNGQWQCTYHYVWSDGFAGPDITETTSSPCITGQGQ